MPNGYAGGIPWIDMIGAAIGKNGRMIALTTSMPSLQI